MTRTTLPALLLALTFTVTASAADAPTERDVTGRFQGIADVSRLEAYEIAGVLILRGKVTDAAEAEVLNRHAQALGYVRVANLVQTVVHDDIQIARTAQRELSLNRSLDGCRLSVQSVDGVVRVAGTVRHELQKDVAVQVLRSIDGVNRVEVALDRF